MTFKSGIRDVARFRAVRFRAVKFRSPPVTGNDANLLRDWDRDCVIRSGLFAQRHRHGGQHFG
jgi:hypothetical protein